MGSGGLNSSVHASAGNSLSTEPPAQPPKTLLKQNVSEATCGTSFLGKSALFMSHVAESRRETSFLHSFLVHSVCAAVVHWLMGILS